MTKSKLSAYGAALALSLSATAAVAGDVAIDCPTDGGIGIRVFTATTNPGDAVCWDYEVGNDKNAPKIEGGPGPFGDLKFSLPKNYSYIGDDVTGAVTVSGDMFEIAPIGGVSRYLITFKTGVGGNPDLDPDWAAFLLPEGVLTGTWSISDGKELSHVSIYATPIPAAAWLLGSGLLGLFAVGRRRKVGAATAA